MPAPVQIMLWVVLALFTLDLGRRMRAARRQVRPPDTTEHHDDGEATEPADADEQAEATEPAESGEPNEPCEPSEPDESGGTR